MNNKTIRSLGVALLCSHLLKEVCENVKGESEIYHHRTKKQLNNLLSTVDSAINKAYNVSTIKKASEFVGRELEYETVEDEIITNSEIIKLVGEVLLTLDPIKIYDVHLLLSNIKEGKKIYTQSEVDKLTKEAEKLGRNLQRDTGW